MDADEAVARMRAELVEDAPTIVHKYDTCSLHGVRLRMRTEHVWFQVIPERVERVVGFRAFVDPETVVMVSSIVADMREHVRTPFDIARWCVPRGITLHDLGIVSWLFPLEVHLRRGPTETVVDVMVFSEDAPDAAKFS